MIVLISYSFSNEAVEEHLEHCVKNGSIAKVINKGLTSYRDPGSAPGRGQKTLHITAADMDLTKVNAIFFQKPYFQKKSMWTFFATFLK